MSRNKVFQNALLGKYNISDKEFFESEIMRLKVQKIANMLLLPFHKKVYVEIHWGTADDEIASTNGGSLSINANSVICEKNVSRTIRYILVLGLMLHEIGHCIFTDFKSRMDIVEGMLKGILLYEPLAGDTENLKKYLKEGKKIKYLVTEYAWLDNAMEDGYNDTEVMEHLPAYKKALIKVNKDQMAVTPDFSELLKEENDGKITAHQVIMNLVLCYADYGKVKMEKYQSSDFHLQTLVDCIPYIDQCKWSGGDLLLREQCKLTVLSILFPYIKEYLDSLPDDEQKADEQFQNDAKNIAQKPSSQSQSSGNAGMPNSGSQQNQQQAANKDEQARKNVLPNQNTSNQQSDTGSGNQSDGNNRKNTDGKGSNKENGSGKGGSASSDGSNKNNATSDSNSANDSNNNSNQNDNNGNGKDGNESAEKKALEELLKSISSSLSDEKKDEFQATEKDLTKTFKDACDEKTIKQAEKEHSERLNEQNTFNYGFTHAGIEATISRPAVITDDMRTAYNSIAKRVEKIAEQAADSWIEISSDDSCESYNYYGQRYDCTAEIRKDFKYFVTEKEELSNQLSLHLLVDQSGSMGGERIDIAKVTSLILYHFATILDVPVTVYGHHSSGCQVYIENYADFETMDENDKYRILSMTTCGNNRDGYALRYVCERACETYAPATEKKLVIVISDGQPNNVGYHMTEAKADIGQIIEEFEQKDVTIITAAIGSDKERIKDIYGEDRFLDITDLNELPERLIEVVSQFLG